MNELQSVEFEMLKWIDQICSKIHVKYFLVCGSALGAVKYNGFIPWDDDLDVGILREDYQIFIQEAPKYLPPYYYLQNYRTSEYYPLLMTKLRDSRTTMIQNLFSQIDMHHGIYVDIFPLDGYPYSQKQIKRLEKSKSYYLRRQSVRNYYGNMGIRQIGFRTYFWRLLFSIFKIGNHTARVTEKMDTLLASYHVESSDLICNHGNWQGKLEYALKEQYGNGTLTTFESLKVRIPERYDEYLTQKYGNWRSDPPYEMQVPSHGNFIDLNRPYTDYIVPLKNGKIRLKTSAELLKDGITPPENYRY